MKLGHLKAQDYRRQPWKNGGGFTTELAIEPPLSPAQGKFLWRLSIANVERSGPFSDFAGYERTLMLLSGEGMELRFEAQPAMRIDRREQPFVFDGGWKAECTLLGGPVQDMNLMVDRARARGSLQVVALRPQATVLSAAGCTLLYVLRGRALASILGEEVSLAQGELLRIDDAQDFPIPLAAGEPDTAIVEVGIELEG